VGGGPIPFGLATGDIDRICRETNAGRHVEVPTTVGFCMYLRRAAINTVGLFDAAAFGRGYGEENDFCLRASARGWRHVVACDTFVYHKGNVSFRDEANEKYQRAQKVLAKRWPDYASKVERHMRRDPAAPARFAATAALFRTLGRQVVALISHGLGGGVQRHIDALVERAGRDALFLMLSSSSRGVRITVPQLNGHSAVELPGSELETIVAMLRSANVSRVHLHHLLGLDLDVHGLIRRLQVPFDVTVHDYFGICPQVNLLPWLDGHYCGEPGPAQCNACIADRPSHYARDITSWRLERRWMLADADRVLCPSEDVRGRLARHGLAERAIVAPHEAVAAGAWPIRLRALAAGQKLRIALLGVLAQQKGAPTVCAVAEAADPAVLEFRLIGHAEDELPKQVARRIRATGEYEDKSLRSLLAKASPHVAWFPAQWPETYSYTLSAAIEAGLPIVASNIGAFAERLAGRPMTWLVDPAAPAREWIEVFGQVRSALLDKTVPPQVQRPARADFYAEDYLRPVGLLRRASSGRTRVVVIPERFPNGWMTPCAYIRLLQPLDHMAAAAGLELVVTTAEEAIESRADAIVTQRHAVGDSPAAETLLDYCRRTNTRLIYDLDDDLLEIPPDHPDAAELRPKAQIVEQLVRGASRVWVSTSALARRLKPVRGGVVVVPNGLDERLWGDPPGARAYRQGPMRVLFMGTATHNADFALIQPALSRLRDQFGERLHFDMIGVSTRPDLPDWVQRPHVWPSAHLSYPAFVNWICQHPGWDVGIAPLADTPFNAAKSAIKAMDYAALGLTVVASDVEAYRATLIPDTGALLVPTDPLVWAETLARLLRNPSWRQELAARTRAVFASRWTLGAQQAARVTALEDALRAEMPEVAVAGAGRREAPPRRRRGADKLVLSA
jgi:glycosyltransferase involved in cell wall biosynthesis